MISGIQELVELGPMSLLLNGDGHEDRQLELEEKIEATLAASGRDFLKVCSFGMLGSDLKECNCGMGPEVGKPAGRTAFMDFSCASYQICRVDSI